MVSNLEDIDWENTTLHEIAILGDDSADPTRWQNSQPRPAIKYGYGDGDGYGDGYGYGYGYGTITANSGEEMTLGGNYRIVQPNGWVFVAQYVKRLGPFEHQFDNVVNIVRTGGRPWDELDRGVGRQEATFRSYGNGVEMQTPIVAIPWQGEIPVVEGG